MLLQVASAYAYAPPTNPAGVQLGALLAWLQQLLRWQIDLTRQTYGALADDEYRGLYVPDAEVDLIGAAEPPLPPALAAERAALAAQRAALAAEAADTPLARLAHTFGLDCFEQDVLLLALAPELDLRFERVYAYIQDDVTRKRPAVDLALRLLCATPAERLAARAAFAPGAPLLGQRLIALFEDGQRQPPLLGRFIKLDDRITAELVGYPTIDPALAGLVELTNPQRSAESLQLAPELHDRLQRAVASHPDGLLLALQGPYGSGRQAVAELLCAEAGRPLLLVNTAQLIDGDGGATPTSGPGELARRIVREALLRGAALLFSAADRLLDEEAGGPWRTAILDALDDTPGLAFLALEQPWEVRGQLRRRAFLRIELGELAYSQRERLWVQRLGRATPAPATLQALASTFRLTGGQIRDAATMAASLARWRSAGEAGPTSADLYAACRAQSSGRLSSLAHKIRPNYRWDDIVLPPDQVTMLREICLQVRHRRTVLERWGFDRHLAMGKGVNVLFAGQSGTGKTMAAEIIAADLGLELYKVDLSTLVSKYIGETEKNLDRIFSAAREANAILFFDEADAIFGKRSEVKDAHDRYANIEVGYLLQKMEEYDGVVILATNLRKNLDDAFVRRLHVAIDFPFPEEPDRARIWQKVFPPDAPLDGDISVEFLARQFKLAGGNIRNIALLAAYLAAEDGELIGMPQVVRAVKREYQKLGRLVTAVEFGPYLALVKG